MPTRSPSVGWTSRTVARPTGVHFLVLHLLSQPWMPTRSPSLGWTRRTVARPTGIHFLVLHLLSQPWMPTRSPLWQDSRKANRRALSGPPFTESAMDADEIAFCWLDKQDSRKANRRSLSGSAGIQEAPACLRVPYGRDSCEGPWRSTAETPRVCNDAASSASARPRCSPVAGNDLASPASFTSYHRPCSAERILALATSALELNGLRLRV